MILIDATNLSSGGGGVLLDFLIRQLQEHCDVVTLAADKTGLSGESIQVVPSCSPLGKKRDELLADATKRCAPSTLLCFGNIPPRHSIPNVRTVTYFHNAHLIRSIDQYRYSLKDRLRYALLAKGIRRRQQATHRWVVQTEYIQDAFCRDFSIDQHHVDVIPFFDEQLLDDQCRRVSNAGHGRQDAFIYVSDDRPHKNHQVLLDAWKLLKTRHQLTPELRLTISSNSKLVPKINKLRHEGIKITNLGPLSHADALTATSVCKYCVFPSFLETIGLGMVEGAKLGCLMLTSRMPFVDEILTPTATFDCFSSDSIATTIKCVQNDASPRSPIVHLTSHLNRLIELLNN